MRVTRDQQGGGRPGAGRVLRRQSRTGQGEQKERTTGQGQDQGQRHEAQVTGTRQGGMGGLRVIYGNEGGDS